MLKISGSKLAKDILSKAEQKVQKFKRHKQRVPRLDIILVESDEASAVYANMIVKKCQSIAIDCRLHKMQAKESTNQLLAKIHNLNDEPECDAIIVQFPLPEQIDEDVIRAAIAPEKDVDSAGYKNIGKFYAGLDCYKPCTPESMLRLLKTVENDLSGKKAAVVGRSLVVGRPIAELLIRENCTVTICHSKTKELTEELKSADIVMAAAGRAHLIRKEMLKENAIVIDAGINVCKDGICGDLDPNGLEGHIKAYTPVPGGVGPVTIAVLIEQVIKAYESKI